MTVKEKRELCLGRFEAKRDYITSRCNADIEKHRKGGIKLDFGAELKGKRVKITQRTHEFKYGANIFMLDEFQEDWKNKAYRDMFARYFNLATLPFYWKDFEPEEGKPRFSVDSPKLYRRPASELCMEYCREKGILPKLHCLFYDQYIPKWLPKNNEPAMRELYAKRFREIAERYSGKMYEIEVTNETCCAPAWKNKSVLSDTADVVEWAFGLARKYFNKDTLVINETQPIPDTAYRTFTAQYYLQIKALLAKGTPIDKIGIQNHIFLGAGVKDMSDGEAVKKDISDYSKFMDPDIYFKALDVFSTFGLPLEITEVTVPTLGETEEDEEIQADLLEYLYTIWFSCPKMESIVYWNTVENTAFINRDGEAVWNENNAHGGLFREDMTPKRSAERLYELFNKRWHTDLTLETDENGSVAFRGFYGDYTAEIEGRTVEFCIRRGE